MRQKGITPVIAIILLLLITISMVGFAFVWFTRVSQISSERTESQLTEQLTQQEKKIRIDNAKSNTVTLRNIGTKDVASSELGFFVDDAQASLTSGCATLTVGEVETCTISVSCVAGTGKIKVTAPGNQDVVICK
ncbi:MAG: hypothetical protein HYW26_01640 [Candidatus Aenigmarchaeota archaeon]|nr:hypothetical protein [Candidatus Aenigmarchaeota archaeon]